MAEFNVAAVIVGLAKIGPQMRDAAVAALYDTGDYLVSEIVPITPIEESPLSTSVQAKVDPGTLEVYVGAGSGPSAKYARRQHEDGSLRHDPGRQWHFISDPVEKAGPVFLRLLARRMRSVLGGGGGGSGGAG